jgi:hypothetical protein
MNPWQLMFLQSKVNDNPYTGDSLATQNWAWPQGTWFQKRLLYLRRKRWYAEALWSARDAGPAARVCRPEIVPARLATGNEMHREAAYESYTGANAASGAEHFS